MTAEPRASRPYMPGYGTLPATQGRGLLPWEWAERRLAASRNFWLATAAGDGAPHLMPVWAVWLDGRLWFSSASGSRKARNLEAQPRCSLATEDPAEPVVVHGRAGRVTERDLLLGVLAAENAKYGTDYGEEMVDPAANRVFALRPEWVFALDSTDFTGTPTRFAFG
jgi:nitroimidazol reductase NimA-like FMN-containing flavoprotein (pyridoxamine 5'-phosphate oxidase superfamily)